MVMITVEGEASLETAVERSELNNAEYITSDGKCGNTAW
jgi:hypothetical protein